MKLRLEAAGAHILRTDRDGAVHTLTDGRQVEIHCFLPGLAEDKAASALAKAPDQKQSCNQK